MCCGPCERDVGGVRKAGPVRGQRVRETERSLVREVREVRAKLQMCQTKHTPSKKTVGR